MKPTIITILALIFSLLALGCGQDESSENLEQAASADTNPIAEGCKHLEFGPFDMANLATDTAERDQIHTAYTITLGGEEGAHTGTFIFTSPGGTHYVIVDKAVSIQVSNAAGDLVEGTEKETRACPIAAAVTEFSFEMGQTYTFEMGPASDASFKMAIHVDGASHDHAGHGHGDESSGHEGADHGAEDDNEAHEDHVGHEH